MYAKSLRNAGPMTYEDCQSLTRFGAKQAKIAPNTFVREERGNYVVTFYATPIVTFCPDGAIVLRSGGHHTASTRDRINQVVPRACMNLKTVRIPCSTLAKSGDFYKKRLLHCGHTPFREGMNAGKPRNTREQLEQDARSGDKAAIKILSDYVSDYPS